jgi:peptidoglycan hydrolase-like protein with peptidoglycan-binding domain
VASPRHDATDASASGARVARREQQRGSHRRVLIIVATVVAVVAVAAVAYGLVAKNNTTSAGAAGTVPHNGAPVTHKATTSQLATTTTSTIPPLAQPASAALPTPPTNGFTWGSHGPAVQAYEARMKALHFDPGPVDGVFDQDTQYAVVAVEKYVGLPRDGSIGPKVQAALEHFTYHSAESNAEGDRVEIDLDRQVLTVYKGYQPILITTASTGSGERFCGGVDGCQYAITPAGHFHFYDFHSGWQKGKLGTMWNPYYFNGSIAVHGLQSVPPYPASHGCTRIPMHIADYFHTLVVNGESVYVVGTPMKAGNGYVGPTTTLPTTTTTTVPVKKATTKTTTTHPKVTTTPTTRHKVTPTT